SLDSDLLHLGRGPRSLKDGYQVERMRWIFFFFLAVGHDLSIARRRGRLGTGRMRIWKRQTASYGFLRVPRSAPQSRCSTLRNRARIPGVIWARKQSMDAKWSAT